MIYDAENYDEMWLLCVKYMDICDVISISMTNTHMRALLSSTIWEFYNCPLYVLWGFRPWLMEYNKKYGIEYRFIAGVFTSLESLICAYQKKLIEYFHLYLTIDKYSLCYYDITCVNAGVPFAIPDVEQININQTNIIQQNMTCQNMTQKIMSHVNDCLNDFELINYHIEHEVRDYIITHYQGFLKYKTLLNFGEVYLFSYFSSNSSFNHSSDMACIIYKKNTKNTKPNIRPTITLEKQLYWTLILPENIYKVPLNIL